MFEVAPLLPHNSLPSTSLPRGVHHESMPSNILLVADSVVLGALILIIYDYLCTFDQEVEYVWLRPHSIGRYLFILNRYLPIADLVMSYLGSVLKVNMSTAACDRLYTADTWLTVLGVFVSQVILYLRTIALWAGNRWILWSLGILAVCILAPSLVLAKIYTDSFGFVIGHPNSHTTGCILIHSSPSVFFVLLLLFISETTVVVLTLIRAYKHLRYSNSWWVHQLYESGSLFYVYLLGFTVLNLILTFVAPLSFKTSFTCIQQALHSIFCNRVIFIILSQQCHREDADLDTQVRPTDGHGTILSSILDTYATPDELLPSHQQENRRCSSNAPQ